MGAATGLWGGAGPLRRLAPAHCSAVSTAVPSQALLLGSPAGARFRQEGAGWPAHTPSVFGAVLSGWSRRPKLPSTYSGPKAHTPLDSVHPLKGGERPSQPKREAAAIPEEHPTSWPSLPWMRADEGGLEPRVGVGGSK